MVTEQEKVDPSPVFKRVAESSALTDLFPLVVGFSLVVLAGLLYALKDNLSPVLLAVALLLVLYPYRQYSGVRVVLAAFLLILAAQFFLVTQSVLLPFILSLGFAYLFDPVVDIFEARRVSRTVAILIIDLIVVGGIIFALVVLIPRIISEMASAVEEIVGQAPAMERWFREDLAAYLQKLGFDPARLTEGVLKELPARVEALLSALFTGLLNASAGLSAVLGHFLNLVLVPFLTFYLLRDFDKIRHQAKVLLVPVARQDDASRLWKRVDRILSGFVRGQLIVCAVVGVLTWLGLFLIGIPYSLALGLLAGALNIVPYVGLTITLIVAVLVGLFSPDPLLTTLKIVLVIEVVQILESTALSPRIVGDRVGLHPVWVILAVLLFSKFLGVLGLLLAVPVAAVTKELVVDHLRSRRQREREALQC